MNLHARVLIVDDEPLARYRIREMLRNDRSVQIIGEARNGSEAIAAITSEAPDIVFLDVQMPDIDGFDVLKALPVESMPLVIFVTAYDQHAIRAFDVHAIDYLMKPFDRKRFAKALDRAKAQLQRTNEPD
ncbi:MAG TPA: response regulator, partial [Pyrinomonadaceae bacterium]|nr:response regulator [Pyrinomonadaceae bacterium]